MTKVTNRLGALYLFILVSGLLLIMASPAATSPDNPSGTCPSVNNTPSFTIVYGTVTINGSPASIGTVIEARSPRGDAIGCFEINSTGNFGTMYVYGEDSSVTPPVPGMRTGETILFYIANISSTATPSLIWENDQDLHQVSLSVTTTSDITPPILNVPAPITVEATSMTGRSVSYSVTATDTVDPNPVINCVPVSGAIFSLGTTSVACTATDNSGNSSNSSFYVTVEDTTTPVLTVPDPITVEATSMVGMAVSYTVTATDTVDPSPNINCTPSSGSVFPLGTTSIACTTIDNSGNSADDSFDIIVVDRPPVLTMPSPITVEADSMAGTVVSYIVTATDVIDSNPEVNCVPISGSIFPLGTTSVDCTATDDNNNSVNGNFDVTVADTIAPVLTMPEPITIETETPGGTAVTYNVTATDTVDPNPNIACTPSSGGTFPLGITIVNCTATDDSNNSSSSSFSVTIVEQSAYLYLPLIVK